METNKLTRTYAALGRLVSATLIPLLARFRTGSSRERVRAAVIVGDEILLVKNWFGSQQWEMPGGGRKRTETYVQAISRELNEELGIAICAQEFVHVGDYLSRKSSLHVYWFRVFLKEKPQIRLNRKELLAAKWFKILGPVPECDEETLALILSISRNQLD